MDEIEKPDVGGVEPEPQEEPKVEADRPEENFKAELARKNAYIAQLEAERVAKETKVVKYDPQDITTWSDNDLKMLVKSPDANLARYKDQAEDLLLERKLDKQLARRQEDARREAARTELESKYPEALDPTSDMAQKISKVMQEYDLSKTPAGRLVAAKIVAAESKASATKGADSEKSRVARVKGQMVDGDRPKPTEVKNPKGKIEDLKADLMDTKHEAKQVDAVGKILRERGMSQDQFFKR